MRYKTIFIICLSFFLGLRQNANAQTEEIFNYVSDTTQTWTVPACINRVTVQLWAGGGGSGNDYCTNFGECSGAAGGYYEGILTSLITGDVLSLTVPSGGQYQDHCDTGYYGGNGGWPGGGKGGEADRIYVLYAGGGGGYAAVAIGGTYYVIAGAGGGGSANNAFGYGGGGGGKIGQDGDNSGGPTSGGTGGTQSNGGYCQWNQCSCDTLPVLSSHGSYLQGGFGGGA